MAETISVDIAADGSLSYTVKGIKGRGCKELTKAIDALGTVTESKTTGEYCQIGTQQTQKAGK